MSVEFIGSVFSRLTVMGKSMDGTYRWKCLCECGKFSNVSKHCLLKGIVKSCGCLMKESNVLRFRKHNKSYTAEYQAYKNMKARCYQKTTKFYNDYGGRGITVCKRWLKGFEFFYKDMGDKPSPKHSLDRRNNNLGYTKNNCYWATRLEQQLNRRNTIRITYNGQTKYLVEWEKEMNANRSTLYRNLREGKSFDYIFKKFKK